MKPLGSAAGSAAFAVLVASTACAQQPAPADKYVTREEYEKLKSELDAVKKQMAENRKEVDATAEDVDKTIEEIQKNLRTVNRGLGDLVPGKSDFLITGYTFAGFSARHHEDTTFSAGISPIFLWKIGDRILIEAEPEFDLESEEGEGKTNVNLEYADISFVLNDYMTLRGGLFLTPFGQFPERIHPAWINKLPDFPLVYKEEGGLVPFSSLGFELRGAFPVHSMKFNYALYVANGPQLRTDSADGAGTLEGGNFDDNNSNKMLGGRIGFLPLPELEIGYSIQGGEAGGEGFHGVNFLLQGVDLAYVKDFEPIKGTVELRAEWVWSDVDTATYDPDGSLGFGPLRYRNRRNGGYVQLAYRPTKVSSKLLRDFEFVGRYDRIDVPKQASESGDEQRFTIGLNYWIGPSAVIKAAYQLDDREVGSGHSGFLLQGAVGF